MTAAIIDTLQITKKAREAGFTEAQAEFQAEVLAEVVGQLATKSDLKELALATKSDIKELARTTKSDLKELETRLETRLEGRIDAKAAEIKSDLIKWLATILMGQLGLIITVIYKFSH